MATEGRAIRVSPAIPVEMKEHSATQKEGQSTVDRQCRSCTACRECLQQLVCCLVVVPVASLVCFVVVEQPVLPVVPTSRFSITTFF
jgi:hypothetical protein